MPRTSALLVQGIIETDATIGSLDPFILAANELVSEVCAPLGYGDIRLELIERWLAAHFYAVRDLRIASESAGSVKSDYQHKVDLNLAVTIYGQQAMTLDTIGGLASLNKQTTSGITRPKFGVFSLATVD